MSFQHASDEVAFNTGFQSAAREKPGTKAMMSAMQESFLRTESQQREKDRNAQIQRETQSTCGSIVATVDSINKDRSLELTFTDGQPISRVQNASRVNWVKGSSVTLKRVGGEWQCVGPAPWGATQPDFTSPDDNVP